VEQFPVVASADALIRADARVTAVRTWARILQSKLAAKREACAGLFGEEIARTPSPTGM
jgi:hypothetical protein